jgi:hypothetical protein
MKKSIKYMCLSLITFLNLFIYFNAFAANPYFVDRITGRSPAVTVPSDPFVQIFVLSGPNNSQYGFRSGLNTTMTVDHWKTVFSNVGHLTGYSFSQLGFSDWGQNYQRADSIQAAYDLGMSYGGSVSVLPETSTQISNIESLYSSTLGKNMEYFFHDEETYDWGTPGGDGDYRLRIPCGISGTGLQTAADSSFDVRSGENFESFSISFGLYIQDFIFGGSCSFLNSGVAYQKGWRAIFNSSNGFSGDHYVILQSYSTSGTSTVYSLPLSSDELLSNYLTGTITVTSVDADDVKVKISVLDKGFTDEVTIPRSGYNSSNGLTVGKLYSTSSTKYYDVDNIQVYNKNNVLTAKYSFEADTATPPDATDVTEVADLSGNDFDLSKIGTGTLELVNITGITGDFEDDATQYFVDEIYDNRGINDPTPKVISQHWLSTVDGRFENWKNNGFTHGNGVAYVQKNDSGNNNLKSLIQQAEYPTTFAWEEKGTDSGWCTMWIGNVSNYTGMDEYMWDSAITMLTLMGVRWFPVYTPMSDGHLGTSGLTDYNKAITNADYLYGMARTASYFEGAKTTLINSEPSTLSELSDAEHVISAVRKNVTTGEVWFAGFRSNSNAANSVTVDFGTSGTVTYPKTGETTQAGSGTFTLPLYSGCFPYYFNPD